MPPHEGLVHLKEYDVKDSNVELIGTDIDHRVKYSSAATEPAWNNGKIGRMAGLFIWRIENFEVVAWPQDRYGQFFDGDSYIVLHSYKIGGQRSQDKLGHDVFFWLGRKTSQDEAGTAAYKTVELDGFLHGVATQHRELQEHPSDEFVALFPRISILSGGVRSGFRHIDHKADANARRMLLRVFKYPFASRADSIMVHEVEPVWQSLDEDDVFILDDSTKIWVWQGKNCSPMEKAEAAQVVHDLTLAKHVDVEVLTQSEARSHIFVDLLGGPGSDPSLFKSERPVQASQSLRETFADLQVIKLFRLSDTTGHLKFELTKEGQSIRREDFNTNDVFLLDRGTSIWVWQGAGASRAEKMGWARMAQAYVHQMREEQGNPDLLYIPISKVVEGNESAAFTKALNWW